jgi:uncharacterized protein
MSADQSALAGEGSLRGLDRMLELQELDTGIDRLLARRAELESEEDVRTARARLAEAEAALGELQLSLDAVSREQGRMEGDVELIGRKIQAERTRMMDGSVTNPKELQSIQAEVQSLEGRKSRKEDELLEQMEQREELEARLGPLEEQAEETRRSMNELQDGSARELAEIEASLGERAARRETLVQEFDPDLLELYEELRRAKKGIGASALVGGVCQGCHQKLSPVYLSQLKRERGVWRCEYCRRILIPS